VTIDARARRISSRARRPPSFASQVRPRAAQRFALRVKARRVESRGGPFGRRASRSQDEGRVDAVEIGLARKLVAWHGRDEADEPVGIRHAPRPQSIERRERRRAELPEERRLRRRQEPRQRVEDALRLVGIPAIDDERAWPVLRQPLRGRPVEAVRRIGAGDSTAGQGPAVAAQVRPVTEGVQHAADLSAYAAVVRVGVELAQELVQAEHLGGSR
jgi:hypothetical protein